MQGFTVLMGNTSARQVTRYKELVDGELVDRESVEYLSGNRICTIGVPDGVPLVEALITITKPQKGVWDNQSDQPPAWVECSDDGLEAALASHYGCPRGRTEGDWQ